MSLNAQRLDPPMLHQESEDRKTEAGTANRVSPLIAGISQDLTLFGRTFHLQTELCNGGLRTEIFLGGRLLTTRKAHPNIAERAGAASQRKWMKEFHRRVVSGLVARSREHQEMSPSTAAKLRSLRRSAKGPDTNGPSPIQQTSGVLRLVTELQDRIEADSSETEPQRLEQAARALTWAQSSPVFKELRIDEQLKVHLLVEQIESWRQEGQDPGRAHDLWHNVSEFNVRLSGIHLRAEFAAKDAARPSSKLEADAATDEHEPKRSYTTDREEKLRAHSSPHPGAQTTKKAGLLKEKYMAKVNLDPLAAIDGFVGTCLVDSDSGMMLGAHGGGPVNLELAAAGNTQVVRAKRQTMSSLKLDDKIEDILISLGKQYHLIRPLESNPAIFIYLVLDRNRANLAMARLELKNFESGLNL